MTNTDLLLVEPKRLESLLQEPDRASRLSGLLAGTDISPERFVGMTVQAIARQPKLLRCTRESVLLAVLSVAEMGLAPTGAYGGAWLVPYGDQCKYIIDWRGFLKLAYRSGILKDAYAKVVYEADEFRVIEGTNPQIIHEPNLDADRGNIAWYYAVAHLRNGGHVQHVMSAAEVEAIRDRQPRWESGPWGTDGPEMGRKTVIRNLFKYIPEAMTPELAQALEQEDAMDRVGPTNVTPISSRRARVMAALTGAETDAAGAEEVSPGQAPPEVEGDQAVDPDVPADDASMPEVPTDAS